MQYARMLLLAFMATTAGAQVLTTEVWVGDLDLREGRFVATDLKNVSNHPGYDNQPSFFAGGESLLFSSERAGLAETGLGVQVMRYELAAGRSAAVGRARGFSPTPAPDGRSFMTLREGTVWLYDLDGTPRRALLPAVKTAGYFNRIDATHWVLFMNEPDRSIALWDGTRGSLTRVVPGAVTAPYRVPAEQAVTFVVDDGGRKTLMRLELTPGGGETHRALATIPFATGGHHVWTPRGTLLMASGNTIHEWDPRHPEAWPAVQQFSEPGLQGITRIALSPAGDHIALVSVPDDLTVLRETREASNRDFAAAVARQAGTQWLRTPERFELAADGAVERGTSLRRWRSQGGAHELRGAYTVTWKKSVSGSGTPAWSVENETYVPAP